MGIEKEVDPTKIWCIEALETLSHLSLQEIDEDILFYETWLAALRPLREAVAIFRRTLSVPQEPIDVSALFPESLVASAEESVSEPASEPICSDDNPAAKAEDGSLPPDQPEPPVIQPVKKQPAASANVLIEDCHRFLSQHGPSAPAEIAEGTGHTVGRCTFALGRLCSTREAMKDEGGKWRLRTNAELQQDRAPLNRQLTDGGGLRNGSLKNGFRELPKPQSQSNPSLANRIVGYLKISQPAKPHIIAADLNEMIENVERELREGELFHQARNGKGWVISTASEDAE